MKVQNQMQLDLGFLQRDSAEHEEYAEALSSHTPKAYTKDNAGSLMECVISLSNMQKAFKKVARNKGAQGIDERSIEDTRAWLKDHYETLREELREGRYKPQPTKRVYIPKDGGGTRGLSIPTVIDRIIQQAIVQVLTPLYEVQFSETSYGFRPNKSAHRAIYELKRLSDEGYSYATSIDIKSYFDTLNHNLLLEIVRRTVKDKELVGLIKKYLKAGVLENGVVIKTNKGTPPQGGNLSPLLANIYLNEFDQEMERRHNKYIRYADDIIVLSKSKAAAQQKMHSSCSYLENKLKLTTNKDKTKVVKVYYHRFKFLGFTLGKRKDTTEIRIHKSAVTKAKQKLRELTKRNRGKNVRAVMGELKVFLRGWINYFKIAKLKTKLEQLNGWLRRRIRMYIWKQWKRVRTRIKNLKRFGASPEDAIKWGNIRKGYWRIAASQVLTTTLTNDVLAELGYFNSCEYFKIQSEALA